MRTLFSTDTPLLGLGMTSLVLGTIALLVSFLPVLGIPLCSLGLVFGIVGFVLAIFTRRSSPRWSAAGVAMCCLSLVVNLAIANAPGTDPLAGRPVVPRPWQPEPDRPYVPPPARQIEGW